MLEANVDNKANNKPNTLKEAIRHSNQPKWKEAIQAEYDFTIQNET